MELQPIDLAIIDLYLVTNASIGLSLQKKATRGFIEQG